MDTNVAYADCAELSADNLYCDTDFDEYYEFSRSCLPNEPLVQFVQLIETAFFSSLSIDSTDYVNWDTLNEKAVLKALLDTVSWNTVPTGDLDTNGDPITQTVSSRSATMLVANIVESVAEHLFAGAAKNLSEWLAIADPNTSVDMDVLYDVADAIIFVPYLSDEDKAWRARQVKVS